MMPSFFRRTFLAWTGGALAAMLALGSGPASARSHRLKHLLVVSMTAGFHHSSVPLARETIQKLGQENRLWETEFAGDADEIGRTITADHLKGIDLVVFANTTGELPISDENKAAFMAWLRAGHGFVGTHSATDTLYQWADYGKMIGGYFDGHPWHEKVTLHVEDPAFPGMKPLVDNPVITDEIYQFRDWSRDDKHVILSIDDSSIDTTKGKRADRDYAVAWARMEGKGRVFYTSLGHEEAVWNDPRFQSHLLGGIKWALGLAKADVKLGTPAGASAR